MKRILLVIFILFSIGLRAQQIADPNIYGVWQLEYVESENGMESPGVDYKLTIRQGLLSFNTDVNECGAANLTIDGMMIEFNKQGCTRICCDGSRDPLGARIDYQGSYILQDDLLRITNLRTYVLRKVED